MSNADPIDDAQDRDLLDTAKAVQAVRNEALNYVQGQPGDCLECGLFFNRVVRGMCAKCRDAEIKLRRQRCQRP
jgi:hypothetical protein